MPACSVSPNPCPQFGLFTVEGSGFDPGEYINVRIQDDHGSIWGMPPVDGQGRFAFASYADWPGTSTVSVYHLDKKGHFQAKVIASCTFEVV